MTTKDESSVKRVKIKKSDLGKKAQLNKKDLENIDKLIEEVDLDSLEIEEKNENSNSII
jgi:hypothetical protein